MKARVLALSLCLAAAVPATAAEKLKVGMLKMAALTNVWVAQQSGIFAKNGLDVEFVEFRNGNEAISANRGGSVDIILSIPGTAMAASERGFDLTLLGQNETAKASGPDSGSMLVLPDSPIKSLRDLAGKRVASSALHGQFAAAVQAALMKAGVDPKSVQLMEMPFTVMGDALKAKQIDAIGMLDPWTTQLMQSGAARNISWIYIDSLPEQPLGAWYAKSDFIAKNKDATQRFVKSIQESIDYMNADEPRARHNVAMFTGLDPKLTESMPLNRWDWRINSARWQSVIDMMHTTGELQEAHKASEFISDAAKTSVVQ